MTTPVQTGNAVPAPNAPAPIPPARRPFRRIDGATIPQVAGPPKAYNTESGIPPLIGMLEGYQESDHYDNTFSTFVPSGLNLQAVWYLASRRLSSHDRLLKDTVNWHPLFDNLYLSTAIWYHVLRCRRDQGYITTDEHNFLATIEEKYKPSQIHIPGVYVPFFQAISTTASPYPWQSLIGPALPVNALQGTQAVFYIPTQSVSQVLPSPIIALDMLYNMLTTNRATVDAAPLPPFHGAANAVYLNGNITNGASRHIANTIYGRTGNPASARVEDAFWYNNVSPNNRAAGNVPVPSRSWDLPVRPTQGNGLTVLNVAQFMCLTDLPDEVGATTRYRNWFSAYSATMNLVCQYVPGSRTLNDISTTGFGASTTVWQFTNTLNCANPAVAGVAAGTPWTNAQLEAIQNARYFVNLQAAGIIRDPELNAAALQVAAAAMPNVDITANANSVANARLRTGPFWNQSQCANAPTIDVVPLFAANVANCIHSVANK